MWPLALPLVRAKRAGLAHSDEVYERLASKAGPPLILDEINVVTGPLFVEDAEPGDSLSIEILHIGIARCWSVWEVNAETCGCLASKRLAVSSEASIRSLPISSDGRVHLSERLAVPLQPMIGCIATAPPSHSDHVFGCGCSTFEPTYAHGGNMDLSEVCVGTRVTLPVFQPGALLFVGDLHASMGPGEPCWLGLEAAGSATLRVTLVKGTAPPFPRLLLANGDEVSPDGCIVHDSCALHGLRTTQVFTAVLPEPSHDAAMQHALSQAYDHLLNDRGLTPEEAFGYLVARCGARFGGPAARQVLCVVPDPSSCFHDAT